MLRTVRTLPQYKGPVWRLSFLASYLGILQTTNGRSFLLRVPWKAMAVPTRDNEWQFHIRRLAAPWSGFEVPQGSCRRSTWLGLGLKILQKTKILKCCG